MRIAPYKNKTAASKFLDLLRKLLGISNKQGTAFNELVRLSSALFEQPAGKLGIMDMAGKAAGVPLTEAVSPSSQTIINSPPKPLTQLQAAPTAGQKTVQTAQKIYSSFNDEDFWTKFRIAAVDPASGLMKTLSKLPVFQDGQLRADMLVRAFNQCINLIKNGLQSGIPVLNADGSVVIRQDENNLWRSQKMADADFSIICN